MAKKTENRGGSGRGQGRKKLSYDEKKHPVTAYIKGLTIKSAGGKQKLKSEIESNSEKKYGSRL